MPVNFAKKHPLLTAAGGILTATFLMSEPEANNVPTRVSRDEAACDVKMKGGSVFEAVVYDTASNKEMYRFVESSRTMETPLVGAAKVRTYKKTLLAGEFIVNASKEGRAVSCEIIDDVEGVNNSYEVWSRHHMAAGM